MASNQYVRHHDGIGPSSALIEERTVTDQDPLHVLAISGRQQTLRRYVAAAKTLEAAIQEQEDGWRQFDFPELPGELEQSSDVDSRRRIDSARSNGMEEGFLCSSMYPGSMYRLVVELLVGGGQKGTIGRRALPVLAKLGYESFESICTIVGGVLVLLHVIKFQFLCS